MLTNRPIALRSAIYIGSEKVGDAISAIHPAMATLHPKLIAALVRANTHEGDILLDPFGCDGTIAIEALRLGRRAIVVDPDPVTSLHLHAAGAPARLPVFRGAFREVQDKCARSISDWYVTACPKCGASGTAEELIYSAGKLTAIRYACACSRVVLRKEPDAADRRAETRFKDLKIPAWHPEDILLADGRLSSIFNYFGRRTIAALSIILRAIENQKDPGLQNALLLAFVATLESCCRAGCLAPNPSAPKRAAANSWREGNAWNAFAAGFERVYAAKKAASSQRMEPRLSENFSDLISGRAQLVLLRNENLSELPDGTIDFILADYSNPSVNLQCTVHSIQSAWLANTGKRNNGPQAASQTQKTIVDLQGVKRLIKPGGCAQVLVSEHPGSTLAEAAGMLDQAGFSADRIVYQPKMGAPSDARKRFTGGYIISSEPLDTVKRDHGNPTADDLSAKLERALQTSLTIHGKRTSVELVLRAFYQSLDGNEIRSLFGRFGNGVLPATAEPFPLLRDGTLLHARIQKSARQEIPRAWRQPVLDAMALADGSSAHEDAVWQIVAQCLSVEGLTLEDMSAIRMSIRPAEVQRHQRERTIGLLRKLGQALGYTCRTESGAAKEITWRAARDRQVVIRLDRAGMCFETKFKQSRISEWGALSYFDFEQSVANWCRNHPEKGKNLLPDIFVRQSETAPIEPSTSEKDAFRTKDYKLRIIRNRKVCDLHYLMELEIPKTAAIDFQPGQFFHVLCDAETYDPKAVPLTLRRPLSIHRVEYPGLHRSALAGARDIPDEIRMGLVRRPSTLQFLYRVLGAGTTNLSRLRKGAMVSAIGPCGAGFTIGDARIAVIVAGGIGVAPLAALAEELRFAGKEVRIYLGAVKREMLALAVSHVDVASEADANLDLQQLIRAEFEEIGAELMSICTDDGSVGAKGLVTEMFAQGIRDGCMPLTDVCVYACGPKGMMAAVAEIVARHGLPCQVSLEERMACGIGACYACTCRVAGSDGVTRKKRVCRDGPVFAAKDVQWKD
jgi:dihydroorotate dehydrogenase electron transfer subunit